MIKAENISKSYEDLHVLKNVSLEVPKATIASIVGKSGAGKSTLLHILGTLDNPDSGKVIIDGVDTSTFSPTELAKFRNQKIGFIFQFHHLLNEFSALENVMIPGLIMKRDRNEVSEQAKKLLAYLGLADRINHKPKALSGGEQQRVAVARALVNSPAIVFADEPTGNLDTYNSSELHELFIKLRDDFGQSFIIVTHNEDLANLSDLKFNLIDGKIADEV